MLKRSSPGACASAKRRNTGSRSSWAHRQFRTGEAVRSGRRHAARHAALDLLAGERLVQTIKPVALRRQAGLADRRLDADWRYISMVRALMPRAFGGSPCRDGARPAASGCPAATAGSSGEPDRAAADNQDRDFDHSGRSVLVRGIEPVGEPDAGGPILAALQEIASPDELAVGVFAGLLARDRVIPFTGRERRDLALAGHFEQVMIDDAFGDAAAADQHAVIAQDHERPALEIAHQFRRHVVVELEPLEFVIFDFAVEPQRMLVDRQEAEFVRRDAHAGHGMRMQCRIEVRAVLQQTGMDDQRAALDRFDIGIGQDVSVEIDLQQRRRRHFGKHPIRALDQHVIRFARHPQSEMVVGQIVDAVMGEQAIPGGEFDPRRPFLGADLIADRFAVGDELNRHVATSPDGDGF